MKKPRQLSSKPIRKGKLYCSPACGRGCTWQEYQDAKKDCKELIHRLKRYFGTTWKPHIWENLGWHYCAISANNFLRVHPVIWNGKVRTYHAFLSDDPKDYFGGGKWVEGGRTPFTAVMRTLKHACKLVEKDNLAIIGGIAAAGTDVTRYIKPIQKYADKLINKGKKRKRSASSKPVPGYPWGFEK